MNYIFLNDYGNYRRHNLYRLYSNYLNRIDENMFDKLTEDDKVIITRPTMSFNNPKPFVMLEYSDLFYTDELIQRADFIACTSKPLYDKAKSLNEHAKIILTSNGSNFSTAKYYPANSSNIALMSSCTQKADIDFINRKDLWDMLYITNPNYNKNKLSKSEMYWGKLSKKKYRYIEYCEIVNSVYDKIKPQYTVIATKDDEYSRCQSNLRYYDSVGRGIPVLYNGCGTALKGMPYMTDDLSKIEECRPTYEEVLEFRKKYDWRNVLSYVADVLGVPVPKQYGEEVIEVKRKSSELIYLSKREEVFKVSWKMTNWCNYRCEYCHAIKSLENTSEEELIRVGKEINRLIEDRGTKTRLSLIGGEVCYFNLEKIFSYMPTKLIKRILIVTNFSNKLEYWNSLYNYCKNRGITLKVCASLHSSQIDNDVFLDKVIEYASDKNTNCIKVTGVISEETYNDCLYAYNKLHPYGIGFMLQRERDQNNQSAKEYDSKIADLISLANKDTGQEIIARFDDGTTEVYNSRTEVMYAFEGGGFNPKGMYCTGGIDSVRVNPSGTLATNVCGCATKRAIPIEEAKHFPTEPVLCDTDKNCSFCLPLSIIKDKEEAERICKEHLERQKFWH